MSTSTTSFEQLDQCYAEGGVEAVLDTLINSLREQKKFHELFEALKMKARNALGLPLLYSDSGDSLDSDVRNQLEDALIAACKEVGLALLEDGKAGEGWMYMRVVGDRSAAKQILESIEISDENIDEMVDVLLNEGVDVGRGFSTVLNHYGTCNSITTYESLMYQKSREEQQVCAKLLLDHLHNDLVATVKADIGQQSGSEVTGDTLEGLVNDREWLFGEHSYHVDTTHLASTVRFSRVLEDEASLRKALDLTFYGRNLNEQFQYAGEEPFADIYVHHALYFQAILGENQDDAMAHFEDRARTVVKEQEGTAAVETYIDLLARLGRTEDAVAATMELLPPGSHNMGMAPSLHELCESSGDFTPIKEVAKTQMDVLGYVSGLLEAKTR
ncbi:MAG: hypothetical protein ACJZ8O_02790 [Pirellulaceae bacterium]